MLRSSFIYPGALASLELLNSRAVVLWKPVDSVEEVGRRTKARDLLVLEVAIDDAGGCCQLDNIN